MLVLSRKKSERILVGDEIVVTVVEIRGDKVRLGIQAPLHLAVHREEVANRIHDEERLRKPSQDNLNRSEED